MAHRRRAIVIGGGIGGLAAAIALERIGVDTVVCESVCEPRDGGAGLVLSSYAMKALEALGLGKSVAKLGSSLEKGEIRNPQGQLLAALSVGAAAQRIGHPHVCIPRPDLHRVLRAALKNGKLRFGARCLGFTQDRRSVTAHFAAGEESGSVLIGADGLHSAVREQLLGRQPPRFAGYSAWRGTARFQHMYCETGTFVETWGRGRRFGWVPMGAEQVYWYATTNSREGCGVPLAQWKPQLLASFGGWHSPIADVIAATDEAAILRNDIYDRPPVRRCGAGAKVG